METDAFARGKRDGERGLDRSDVFEETTAHSSWAEHLTFHDGEIAAGCAFECAGLSTMDDTLKKQRRQVSGGLARSRHLCPHCGAAFRGESLADLRAAYEAGWTAGRALFDRGQQRRRADATRRYRKTTRHRSKN